MFRVVGGKVNADATCVVTDESFLAGATLVPLKRPSQNARCSTAMYPQFQADKGRPVVGCWPIGASAAGNQVAVIEFSRHLTQALASLVVIDGERRAYIDYPATFKGPGDDLWRVDDGGNIHAEGFEVIFLLKRGTAYVIAIDWSGAEGSALSLHVADGPGQFKELIDESWYRSPLFGTGQWALPATLTMPVGSGPVPAVVLVHGSGPGDRDATVGQIKQFKDLALGLASRGIAVLRYDKRTRVHANLMRDLAGLTVKDETIDDAIAAVQVLRSTSGVDPNRIVVLGHSLGGMLVPRIAAAGPPVAGFVVMAGAARPIQQAVVEQARYLAQADGAISAEEQAQINQIEQVMARVAALRPSDASNPERIFGAAASYWLERSGSRSS